MNEATAVRLVETLKEIQRILQHISDALDNGLHGDGWTVRGSIHNTGAR